MFLVPLFSFYLYDSVVFANCYYYHFALPTSSGFEGGCYYSGWPPWLAAYIRNPYDFWSGPEVKTRAAGGPFVCDLLSGQLSNGNTDLAAALRQSSHIPLHGRAAAVRENS